MVQLQIATIRQIKSKCCLSVTIATHCFQVIPEQSTRLNIDIWSLQYIHINSISFVFESTVSVETVLAVKTVIVTIRQFIWQYSYFVLVNLQIVVNTATICFLIWIAFEILRWLFSWIFLQDESEFFVLNTIMLVSEASSLKFWKPGWSHSLHRISL